MAITILLVEDDQKVRGLLRGRLEAAGYAVVETSSAEEALTRYETAPPDLVITDIVLPGRSGLDLIADLGQEYPNARIVAMSGAFGSDVKALLHQSVRAGAIHGLPKPFTTAQLLEVVQAALNEPLGEGQAHFEMVEEAPPSSNAVRWVVAVVLVAAILGFMFRSSLFSK